MPKKIPQEDQDLWIELADQGLGAWEIKKHTNAHNDVRTIENVINRNRAERAASEIRTRARTQALIDHWKQLVESPRQLEEVVKHVPRTLGGKNPVYALAETNFAGNGWSARKSNLEWSSTLEFEDSIDGRLLKDHTGTDSFWRALAAYGTALGIFIGARLAFAQAVHDAINAADTSESTRIELAGVEVCDQLLYKALTDDNDSKFDLEELMTRSKDGTRLEINGALLVSSIDGLPAETDITKAVIELRSGTRWKGLAAAHLRLRRASKTLTDEVLILRSVPSLPGTCRACSRIA